MHKAKGKKLVLFGRAPRMAILGLFAFAAVSSLILAGFTDQASAVTANGQINFQARLENASGSIAADGNYNVQFKIYNASTSGTLLWTEDHLNSASAGIHVVNGYLTVSLGSLCAFATATCQGYSDTAPNWSQQLWLTMNIGNTNVSCTPFSSCVPDGEMSPRIQLTAVPYAFQAGALGQTDGSGNLGTLSFPSVTNNPAITLPNASGTVCINTNNCNYAPATGGAGYVQLQNTTPGTQQTGNFNISGTGILGGLVIQNASSQNLLTADTGTNHLKVYDGTATQNYVDIYYDDGTSSAIISASSGTTKIGSGTGPVTITAGASAAVTITGHSGSSFTTDAGNLTLDVTSASAPTLNIGTGGQAKSIVIGNATGATSVQLQAGTGGILVASLSTATSNSAAVCRDTSTNKLTVCDSTNTTGAAFLQGGNSFGATANLGTNDSNNLAFRTGGATKLTLNTSGNLQFSQVSTINIASAATGTALTIQGGAATSGASVGGNLVLQGGAGASTGASGSVLVKSNTNNSTTAFQVQDASGYGLLTADTTNSRLGVGINVPLNTFSVAPIDYQTGTVTRTNSSATLVGTGTTWTSAMNGDIIVFADGTTNYVGGFTDATHITMSNTYTGTTDGSPIAYRFYHQGLDVASNGLVGIGITGPDAALSVRTAGQNAVVDIYGVGGSPDYGVIQVSSAGSLTNSSNRPLSLQPNAGDVLIGTGTDLGARLSVAGTALVKTTSSSAFVVQNGSAAPLFTADTSGQAVTVSVNTSSTAAALAISQSGSGGSVLSLSTPSQTWTTGIDGLNGNQFSLNSSTAQSGTSATKLGYAGSGALGDTGDQNLMSCVQAIATGNGTITSMTIKTATNAASSPANNFSMAIYSASGTNPWALVASTSSGTLSATPGTNTLALSASITAGTTYWLCANNNSGSSSLSTWAYDYTPGYYRQISQTYGTWPASVAYAAPTQGASFVLYATVTPTEPFTGSLLTIGQSGQTKLQNSTDSTSAFQIQDASGFAVLNYDTTNQALTLTAQSSQLNPSSELFTNFSSGWSGTTGTTCGTTNWYVNPGSPTQAQHCPGNVTALTDTGVTVVAGTSYQVKIAITGTCTSSSDTVTVTIGSKTLATIDGTNCNGAQYTYIADTTSTAQLKFTPTTNYAGTIQVVSFTQLSGTVTPLFVFQNSNGASVLEARTGFYTSNMLFGVNSGVHITTSSESTSFGFYSQRMLTSGQLNTAVGAHALEYNVDGSNNTVLGAYAMQNTVGGDSNVAIGTYAIQNNAGGQGNQAIGDHALYQNTLGNSNVAIGTYTLQRNTQGFANIGIGGGALQHVTTGDGNIGIGNLALLNTTGGYNVGIGYDVLHDLSTGTENVAVGDYAGYQDYNGNFATTTNVQYSAAIGAYAQVQADNSIVLGSVDNPTKVGIGITVPGNTFSVSPLDYQTGTVTRTNGSATLTGSISPNNPTWTSTMVGDIIVFADGTTNTVSGFTDATHITMGTTYTGTTDASPVYYRFHHIGLQVTSGGYLGINTVSPATPLDINGNASVSGQLNAGPVTSLSSYVNLVPNWSFEVNNDSVTNFPDQWGPSGETNGTVSVLTTSSTNGKNSLELSSGASSSNIAATSSCFPINPSQTYSYATDAYSSAAVNGFVWRVFYFTDSSCTTAASTTFHDVTGTFNNAITASWQTFTGTQTSPINAYFAWIRVYNFQTTNSNLVIDSMVMTPQFKTGLLVTRTDTSAFKIQNASSTNIFSVDSSGKNVIIGVGTAGESTPSLLVLDSKSATDGINPGTTTCTTSGSVYYNSSDSQFRACRNGKLYNLIAGVDVQSWTSSAGTFTNAWVKPSGVTMIMVIICGGGGGGGGGASRANTTTAASGGAGGGGGGRTMTMMAAADVASPQTITVGVGGGGGGAGTSGTNGGQSSFGGLKAGGGAGGSGGSTATSTGGGGGGLVNSGASGQGGENTVGATNSIGFARAGTTAGAAGGSAETGGAAGGGGPISATSTAGGSSVYGGSGGGSGGGTTTTTTSAAGGTGGAGGTFGTGGGAGGGLAGTNTGTAGSNSGTSVRCGGGGGGGGGSNGAANSSGGAGGAGGNYGGGGGGGGVGTSTGAGGVGGAGGIGAVWVFSW